MKMNLMVTPKEHIYIGATLSDQEDTDTTSSSLRP